MNETVSNFMAIAEDSIVDAQVLFKNERYRACCGRSYYAYFDAVRALLVSKEIFTKSHSGVRSLFAQHFVKDGPFSKQDSILFNILFELRLSSDYDATDSPTENEAAKALAIATAFVDQVGYYLRANGSV